MADRHGWEMAAMLADVLTDAAEDPCRRHSAPEAGGLAEFDTTGRDDECLNCKAVAALNVYRAALTADGRAPLTAEGSGPLLDPDCRDGKCGSCVGAPCEHHCHRQREAVPA